MITDLTVGHAAVAGSGRLKTALDAIRYVFHRQDVTDWQNAIDLPPLADDAVHVWLIHVRQPYPVLEAWRSLLTETERVRLAAYRSEPERRQRLAGWAVRRELLGRELARDPRSLVFGTESNGRPVLTGVSRAEEIQFNISYSGEYVALGLARGRRIGVDLEQQCEMDYNAVITAQFSPEEILCWREVPEGQRMAAFFNAWTRKEAFVKALGTGLARPLSSFVVEYLPGRPAAILRCAEDPAVAEHWHVAGFEPVTGYTLAIVAEHRPCMLRTAVYHPAI